MDDNHKASVNAASGAIAGYISRDPATMRCRVEIRGEARISVTAIDIPEALILAAFADRLMLMAYPDPEPAEAEEIGVCITEIAGMIRGGATLAIEGVTIGADMTAEALPLLGELADGAALFGAPPQAWPVWPETTEGSAVGKTLRDLERIRAEIARAAARFERRQ